MTPHQSMPTPPLPLPTRRRQGMWAALLAFAMAMLVGCGQEEGVVTYTIPKKVPEQLLPGKDRMLAAIVPRGEKVWFFKILGPQDSVDLVGKQFRSFVGEITFDDRDEPVLKSLPEGWRRGGEKPMRFATIDINTAKKQLDLSVSNLSVPPGMDEQGWKEYVAQNVNRWRGQVGLDASTDAFAGGEAFAVKAAEGPYVKDSQAIWVDVVGQAGGGSMMPPMMSRTPPMMTGGGPAATPGKGPSDGTPPTSAGINYDSPKGWNEQPARGMREAAFKIGSDEAEAEVTIITAGGDLRNNVARWMGQVAGGRPEDAEVDAMLAGAEKFEVSGRPAQRFIIPGDGEKGQFSIDATIVEMDGGRSKFVKMTGDPEIVAKQSEAMRTFLDSLTF